MTTLALAGDTMLGRLVAAKLADHAPSSLFGAELLDVLAGTDGMVLNLECCISSRGRPVPGRVFHFRAPPAAVEVLTLLNVRAVTLANNHALDFGERALLDTLDHLERAGIVAVGAGADQAAARAVREVRLGDTVLSMVALTDDPVRYAAGADRPGVAYADLRHGLPPWVGEAIAAAPSRPVLATVHWGPNLVPEPVPHVRRAADELVAAGADLVAGHSAHVFHGVHGRVLYDLGDFVDDYAVHPTLRNDLGLLWLVELRAGRPAAATAVPLRLSRAHTTVAHGEDAAWVASRLRAACAELGTEVRARDGRLRVRLTAAA